MLYSMSLKLEKNSEPLGIDIVSSHQCYLFHKTVLSTLESAARLVHYIIVWLLGFIKLNLVCEGPSLPR